MRLGFRPGHRQDDRQLYGPHRLPSCPLWGEARNSDGGGRPDTVSRAKARVAGGRKSLCGAVSPEGGEPLRLGRAANPERPIAAQGFDLTGARGKTTWRRGLRHRRRDPLGQVPLHCQSVSLDIRRNPPPIGTARAPAPGRGVLSLTDSTVSGAAHGCQAYNPTSMAAPRLGFELASHEP
jgi:hypothetical protein